MRIDRAGWPFVGPALLLAAGGFLFGSPIWTGAGVIATAFFLFFFRDPERATRVDEWTVVSPADGRVMVAGTPTGQAVPTGHWQQISIFLSPMDVHVNRIPIGGRVLKVEYHPGRFLPAYRADAGDLNEYTEVWLEHGPYTVIVRQIVGVLARRIVCRTQPGALVKAGERFGVMKFGSRMDLFLPATATLHVHVGDRTVGGVTVLATLPPTAGEHAS